MCGRLCEVRSELELCVTDPADEDAAVEPGQPLRVVVHHQLLVVVGQAHAVRLHGEYSVMVASVAQCGKLYWLGGRSTIQPWRDAGRWRSSHRGWRYRKSGEKTNEMLVGAGGGLHLAGVPGPADQAAAVLAVVLRHPQPVRPLDVEADLVLENDTNNFIF